MQNHRHGPWAGPAQSVSRITIMKEGADEMDTGSEISRAQKGLRIHAIFTMGFLAIEFALGMVTNLFLQFPETNQADQLWAFARSRAPLAAHIVIGMLLLASAILFLIRAARSNDGRWIGSSVVGLIAVVIAFYGGVAFTSTQADSYSLVMALAFIVALLAYGWGLLAAGG